MGDQMPKVDLEALEAALPPRLYGVALKCLVVRKGTARLRATKPDHTKDAEHAIAAYAWRMAAFSVSPRSRHHCMPVCADFYLTHDVRRSSAAYAYRREIGDRVEEAIVNAVPMSLWHGVRRWGQAYGLVGTPRYDADGAVVYR